MTAVCIEEIIANEGNSRAFRLGSTVLATARKCKSMWVLKLDGVEHRVEFWDDARDLILGKVPGGRAFFEARRIHPRHHWHGRKALAA